MLCDFWAQSGKGRRTPTTLVVPCNTPCIFREMLLESQKNLQIWPQPMEFRLHAPQLPAGISVCPGARGQKGKNEETSGMLQRQIQDDSGRYVQITDSIKYSRVRTPYSAFLKSQDFGSQGQFEVPARTLGTHLVERTSWLHACFFLVPSSSNHHEPPRLQSWKLRIFIKEHDLRDTFFGVPSCSIFVLPPSSSQVQWLRL